MDAPKWDITAKAGANGRVELGLKLEKTKRPYPVLVIDHIEDTPTEN